MVNIVSEKITIQSTPMSVYDVQFM